MSSEDEALPKPEGMGTKALKGCGKEGRIGALAMAAISSMLAENYGIELTPEIISMGTGFLFALGARLETFLNMG